MKRGMKKERIKILIRGFYFDSFSQNFLFKAQDNCRIFFVNQLITNLKFFFKNRLIGFDFKGCKDNFRFNSDFDVASLFSYNIKARWNKIVNYGLSYSTIFFDYVFSTYGIIQRNSAIFINQIDPEERLKLFLKPVFIVNIFECLLPGKEF
jgi:hypothetical protein